MVSNYRYTSFYICFLCYKNHTTISSLTLKMCSSWRQKSSFKKVKVLLYEGVFMLLFFRRGGITIKDYIFASTKICVLTLRSNTTLDMLRQYLLIGCTVCSKQCKAIALLLSLTLLKGIIQIFMLTYYYI